MDKLAIYDTLSSVEFVEDISSQYLTEIVKNFLPELLHDEFKLITGSRVYNNEGDNCLLDSVLTFYKNREGIPKYIDFIIGDANIDIKDSWKVVNILPNEMRFPVSVVITDNGYTGRILYYTPDDEYICII